MQTFVPYGTKLPYDASDSERELQFRVDCSLAAVHLDYRRLGKQRVEASQIFDAMNKLLTGQKGGWQSHPAVKMWIGHEAALRVYFNTMSHIWLSRGYKHNMGFMPDPQFGLIIPEWWGGPIHSTHRAALLHKDFTFYSQHGWSEQPKLDYYWPV